MSEQEVTHPIPEELTQKINALRAIATTFNLLDKAHLPHSHYQAVTVSLEFLRSLHEQVLAESLTFPEAKQIPELQQFLNKDVSND